ncbi:MAG: OprD family outer membrane porin [Campylobacterota bacterium]|nr:OprD family outer membrane porin [Campylobacterota bacterium]
MIYKIVVLVGMLGIFTHFSAVELKTDNGKDVGTVSGMIKAMHVLYDKDNGYTPNNGSGYLVKLKYESPDIFTDSLKVGIGAYLNGDTGLTEWESADKKPARGMFAAPRGGETAQFGEIYLSYKYKNRVRAKLGRQILNTPMTKIKFSLMPNFYEAYGIGTEVISGLSLDLMQITTLSYGSRAVTDWMLIGEATGTAGAPNVIEEKGGLGQADFISIKDIAGVDDSAGITALGATYKGVKNLEVSIWDYYTDNIVNNFYADAIYTLGLSESIKMKLSAQYLNQQSVDNFKNPYTKKDIDFWLAGAKAELKSKAWNFFIAYNQSSKSDQMYNIFGSDVAYTSSLFSRNQYRKDVKAYKFGGNYEVIKGLKLFATYANYGKSKTVTTKGWQSTTDAYEIDFCIIYKPTKAWFLAFCNAIRTSEYDGYGGAQREQNHVRLIGSYSFNA